MSDGMQSIQTVYVEDLIRGKAEIEYNVSPYISRGSLERELLSKGYTSMQNKLKHYLEKNHKKIENPEKKERDYKIRNYNLISSALNDSIQICMDRAEVQEGSEAGEAIRSFILYDFISEEENSDKNIINEGEVKKYSYEFKQCYGTTRYKTDVMKRIGNALVGNEVLAELNEAENKHVDRLLTGKSKKGEKVRSELIIAAYMLGMDIEMTNQFLMKGAFTYGLDFGNEWELAAAYIIHKYPVEEQDRPNIFFIHMGKLAQYNNKKEFAEFKADIWKQENKLWLFEYAYWDKQGKRKEFLADWAWKRLKTQYPHYKQKTYLSQELLKKSRDVFVNSEISAIYRQLKIYAETGTIGELSEKNDDRYVFDIEQWIASGMLDKRNRVLEFIYSITNKNDEYGVKITDEQGNLEIMYYPAFEYGGLKKFDTSFDKIKNKKRALCRDDIIKICIVLELSWMGVNYLLNIAGFCKLYVKDPFERALVLCLRDFEEKFGAGCLKLENANGINGKILMYLEQNYSEFIPKNREILKKKEPEWIRWVRENG